MWRRNLLFAVTLLLAALQFTRNYATVNWSYLDLKAYARGAERMPFQARMLMMYPIRWAEQSSTLIRITKGREGALQSPDMLLITVLAFVCICLTGLVVTAFYLRASRRRVLVWMPAPVFLAVCWIQYMPHFQNVLYPYDMLSLFLFNLGLYLIYTRRVWWLVVLFPIATLNREVSLFLIVLFMLDRWAEDGWHGWLKAKFLIQSALLSATWLTIYVYVHHRFAGNPKEPDVHLRKNIDSLLNPQIWPQLAGLGAFLIPILFVYRRRILDKRVRAYLWVILPWLVCMFFFGELVETRVLGELGGLIAVAAVLEFEETAVSGKTVRA